jgi:hypothetical protein
MAGARARRRGDRMKRREFIPQGPGGRRKNATAGGPDCRGLAPIIADYSRISQVMPVETLPPTAPSYGAVGLTGRQPFR